MKTNDQLLAKVQKAALDEVNELPDSPEARARTVALLQAAMSQAVPVPSLSRSQSISQSSKGWRLALAAGLSLLLGASVWFGAQPRGGNRVVASTGPLAVGHQLIEAEVVESGEATLSLQLPPGVLVHLRAQSTVQVRDDGARVVVRRGEVAAEVTYGTSGWVVALSLVKSSSLPSLSVGIEGRGNSQPKSLASPAY